LYERQGYFSWRHPVSGVEYGLGRDGQSAVNQAIEANNEMLGLTHGTRLIHRLSSDHHASDETVGNWIEKFEAEVLPTRNYKKHSLSAAFAKGRAVRGAPLGSVLLAELTVRHVSDFLDAYSNAGKDTWAGLLRQYLIDVLDCACQKGWLDVNPVRTTARIKAKVRRNRLRNLDEFLCIYEAASWYEPFLRRAMELALVTAQRRIDVCQMEFRPRKGATAWVTDGFLWVIQSKTKGEAEPVKLKFPLTLRLNALGWTLEEIIARCRDDVVSAYLVHRQPQRKARLPRDRRMGAAVNEDTLTRMFSAARDRSGLVWPDRDKHGNLLTPPTFHEIRSLAVRLYKEQGVNLELVRQPADIRGDIAGHRDPKMAGLYLDPRAEEWLEVRG
jgi:hypothetical protein